MCILSPAKVLLLFLLVGIAGACEAFSVQEPQKTDWGSYLPEGKGKELLQSVCTSCHDLSRIVQQRKDNALWRQAVHGMLSSSDPQMVEYLQEEINVMAKYLAEYLGPVSPSLEALQKDPQLLKKYLSGQMKSLISLNAGTAEELMQLPGIDKPLAEEIIRYRKEHGPFQSVDDLRKLNGMDAAEFDRIKALLYVESADDHEEKGP